MPSTTRVVRLLGSDAISEIRFDLVSKKMRLKFPKTRSVWEYNDVTVTDFSAMVTSQSPGQVFNNLIRDNYKGHRIDPPPAD